MQARHARGAGVLECADEKEQAAQPIVGGAERIAKQRLNHVDRSSAYALERAQLVLAAVEYKLFVSTERYAERGGYSAPNAAEAAGANTETDSLKVRTSRIAVWIVFSDFKTFLAGSSRLFAQPTSPPRNRRPKACATRCGAPRPLHPKCPIGKTLAEST